MIDQDTQHINLADLMHLYLHQSRAARAAELLGPIQEHQGSIQSSHLLRNHTVEPIILDDEIHDRDAFDFLVVFYSIIEIASMIRYVPDPLPQDFIETSRRHLSEPAVRHYYEDFYPTLLPKLLLRRLNQDLALYEDLPTDPTPAYHLFSEFLGLVNRQHNNEALETFLWFLDDGTLDGYGIEDTFAVLRKPEKFVERLLRRPAKQNALDLSLRGLQDFIAFCLDFDDLLQRCDRYLLLQSAQWHYFSYWFESISEKVGPRVTEAVQSFSSWTERDNTAHLLQTKQHVNSYVQEVEMVLGRLLSGAYGNILRERSGEAGQHPPKLRPEEEIRRIIVEVIHDAIYVMKFAQRPLEGQQPL